MLDAVPGSGAGFELPLPLNLLAYFTFGITGALAGLRRGYDIIGVVFLALITAGGGGLIRDGMLFSSGPATILADGRNFLAVLAAALLTPLIYKHVHRLNRAIAIIDALGLGAFAVLGVEATLRANLSMPVAILGGTITAVGGGLMRDVLVREEPLLFKPGQFYAMVAIAGSSLFCMLIRYDWLLPENAARVTIVVVFLLRYLAIKFNWRTRELVRDYREQVHE